MYLCVCVCGAEGGSDISTSHHPSTAALPRPLFLAIVLGQQNTPKSNSNQSQLPLAWWRGRLSARGEPPPHPFTPPHPLSRAACIKYFQIHIFVLGPKAREAKKKRKRLPNTQTGEVDGGAGVLSCGWQPLGANRDSPDVKAAACHSPPLHSTPLFALF